MIWLRFIFLSAIVIATSSVLAKYGDVIAIRTKLGGLLIGGRF